MNIQKLYDRRETLTEKLFSDIVVDDQNKLNTLLPPENNSVLLLRNTRKVLNFKRTDIRIVLLYIIHLDIINS